MLSCSVVSDSLPPHRLSSTRLLCPWGFSRQKYWSRLLPSSSGFSYPRIESRSPAFQADSLPSEPPGKPKNTGSCSLSLFQGIFLTQELNQVFALQVDSLLHQTRPIWGCQSDCSFRLLHCIWGVRKTSHSAHIRGKGCGTSSQH